ncbi:MAG: hypothetical protein JWO22_2989 [Frankiales bacterium]|nr:hypothetical protein [Frankiales bacterium]
MLLDTDTAQVVTLSAAGVAVLSLGFSAAMLVRVRNLTLAHDVLTGGDHGATFVESVTRQHREVEGLRTDVGHLREDLAAARADLSDALRHVAVVRYDAFGDMGGRLSFSAALLDDAGDGIVITSINGRSETRTYAKGVKAGDSDHSLSPEEQQAIGYANRTAVQPREVAEVETTKRGRFSRR